MSFSAILGRLAGIAGPVLGGVIITVWGFPSLFIVALIIVIFSGVPFFFLPHHERSLPVTFKGVVDWLRRKDHRNEELSFIGRYVDDFTFSLFWPVYMFLVAGTYERQGLAASLGLVFGTVMVYVAGRLFDKKHSPWLFKFGIIGTAVMWLVRGFVRSLGQLVFVEVGTNMISPFYWVTYDSLLYERARGKNEEVLTFMVARGFILFVALLLVFVFALVIAPFPWRFWAMWGLAALGVLFSSVMWEKSDSKDG